MKRYMICMVVLAAALLKRLMIGLFPILGAIVGLLLWLQLAKANSIALAVHELQVMSQTADTPTASGLPTGWIIRNVYSEKSIEGSGIKIDSAGYPHIAYLGTHLYYAFFNGTSWQYEIVDNVKECYSDYSTCPGAVSLILDEDGNPRIAYYGNHYVKYARWSGNNWWIEEVDVVDTEAFWPYKNISLAVDANGGVHLVYSVHSGEDAETIKYAHRIRNGWDIQVIGVTSRGNASLSLALDSLGRPAIAYGFHGSYYIHWNGGEWEKRALTSDNEFVFGFSLVMDANDHPHISYSNRSSIIYTEWTGLAWFTQTVSTTTSDIGWGKTHLALDQNDNPHIMYEPSFCSDQSAAQYAYWTGITWLIQTVSTGCWYHAFALDKVGNPQISLTPIFKEPVLKYLHWNGNQWIEQVVDQVKWGAVGNIAMVISADGRPQIGFHEGPTLTHASWNGNEWQFQAVDRGIWYGGYEKVDLVLDVNGSPHMVYNKITLPYIEGLPPSEIRYASQVANVWLTQTLATDNVSWSHLALDSSGYAHIGYVTADKRVIHVWQTADGWVTETVPIQPLSPSLEYVGWGYYISIAVDSLDHVHIATSDRMYVLYATWTGSEWLTDTVDTISDGTGIQIDMKLASNGDVCIAYAANDINWAQIKYACRSGFGWQVEDVDKITSENVRVKDPSLTLDSHDIPKIAYVKENTIFYAHREERGWQIERLNSSTTTSGSFPFGYIYGHSFALDSSGCPHVIFNIDMDLYEAVGTGAAFTAEPVDGYIPQVVTFTNHSLCEFNSYHWDFGDGITSTLESPTHTYTTQGIYPITLTVSGPSGVFTENKPAAVTVLETVDALIFPETGGVFSYTNLMGNVTTIQIPPGAVTQTTRLRYIPLFGVDYQNPDLAYASQSFDLEAAWVDIYIGIIPMKRLEFALPVTVTVEYFDRVNEETLALHTFDGQNWQDAACGAYERHPDQNWLALPICQIGRFALVGKPVDFYLPLIIR